MEYAASKAKLDDLCNQRDAIEFEIEALSAQMTKIPVTLDEAWAETMAVLADLLGSMALDGPDDDRIKWTGACLRGRFGRPVPRDVVAQVISRLREAAAAGQSPLEPNPAEPRDVGSKSTPAPT